MLEVFFLLIYLFVTINFVMSVTVNVCVFVMCVTVCGCHGLEHFQVSNQKETWKGFQVGFPTFLGLISGVTPGGLVYCVLVILLCFSLPTMFLNQQGVRPAFTLVEIGTNRSPQHS